MVRSFATYITYKYWLQLKILHELNCVLITIKKSKKLHRII